MIDFVNEAIGIQQTLAFPNGLPTMCPALHRCGATAMGAAVSGASGLRWKRSQPAVQLRKL